VLANVLHIAGSFYSCDIAKLLIDGGANVNEPLLNFSSQSLHVVGASPLMVAVSCNNLAIVKLLIKNNADVNQSTALTPLNSPNYEFNSGMTPMHYAALSGSDDCIKELIKNNANLNPLNGLDETPLFLAAQKCNVSTVEILLQHGADFKRRNVLGLCAKDATGTIDVRKLLDRE